MEDQLRYGAPFIFHERELGIHDLQKEPGLGFRKDFVLPLSGRLAEQPVAFAGDRDGARGIELRRALERAFARATNGGSST